MMLHDPLDRWTVVAAGRPDMGTVQHYMARQRRTYIAQLEGLGALAPYYTFPERFAGRRVVHFIDNTVAQSALVHGYASNVDMADISNGFHLLAAGLRMAVYFDYVPSKANIADLPSRGEFAVPRALGAEVVSMRVPPHTLLAGPLCRSRRGSSGVWSTVAVRTGLRRVLIRLEHICTERSTPRAEGPWSSPARASALAGGRDQVRRPDEGSGV